MEEIQKVVQRIQDSNFVLQEVISILKSYGSILSEFGIDNSYQQVEDLQKISKDLEFYRYKLEKNIIEVAFVGLEKAGKSTLINAIISQNILPSDYKRTTYTTTQIQYSENPGIEIIFYSEDEFIKEVFRKMLKDIAYPNYESQTLDTISVEDFKRHFENLKEGRIELYKEFENTLKNDVNEILEGKAIIKPLLTGKVERVPFDAFNEYKQYITDKYKSRAVKEIKIFTDVLKGLENVIIYDLPGFDSPTMIHLKFTEEKIKKADAVVFVKEAENPSIRRLEADVIKETREDDGVKLKDKVFYFCNMVDKIPTVSDLQRIKEDFIEELRRYDIFKDGSRIIYGSALAKLQREGIDKENHAISGLTRLGVNDGIQELLDRLVKYNQTERREVLLRRIEALIWKLREIAEKLYEKIEDSTEENISDIQYVEAVISTIRDAKQKIMDGIEEFHYKIKQLPKHGEISQIIKDHLESLIRADSLITDEQKEKIRREVEIKSSTTEIRPDDFNRKLRDSLFDKVNSEFSRTVENSIKVKLNDIKQDISEIFTRAFELDEAKKQGFLEKLEAFYISNGIKFSLEEGSLNNLIERFGGDIIQLLIQNPVNSEDRKNKFKEIEREFYSLLAYHKDFNPDMQLSKMPIVNDILHQSNTSEVTKQLEAVLESKGISLSPAEKLEIVNLLSKAKNQQDILSSIESNRYIKDYSSLKTAIKNNMVSYSDSKDDTEKYRSYDDVIEEIKVDINNLRTLMFDCIVNAINVEKMIVNQATSYINNLKKLLNEKAFDEFVNRNMAYIKPEFVQQKIRLQTRQQEIKQLKAGLEQLIKQLKLAI